jgi:hypothetical protein
MKRLSGFLSIFVLCFLLLPLSVFSADKSSEPITNTKMNKQTASDILEFEVSIGKTANGFIYSNNGELLFKGKPFRPAIKANINYVKKFKLSILKSKNIAAAIAMDVDGKNSLFVLDLNKGLSLPLQKYGCPAADIFWSPSQKYMLALCAYEGERFISLDIQNNKIINGEFLGSSHKIWRIQDHPKWIQQKDILEFTVNEICNYYDNPGCDDKVLATYKVLLKASSLKTTIEQNLH